MSIASVQVARVVRLAQLKKKTENDRVLWPSTVTIRRLLTMRIPESQKIKWIIILLRELRSGFRNLNGEV